MAFTNLLIDLDDTLYPPTTGIWDLIGDRINLYMQEKVGYPAAEVSKVREGLFHQYGTTLRGLQIEHGIDPLDYLDYVHRVPIEDLLLPDPAIESVLTAFPHSRWIFTNASRAHALRVLRALQVGPIFAGLIDILDIAPYCKPMPEAFHLALKKAAIPDARSCILVDDNPRNLAAARLLGMYTIQVGGTPTPGANATIPTIHHLASVLPTSTVELE